MPGDALIITRLAAAIGAAVADHGPIDLRFALIARTAGLAAGLRWLITTLRGGTGVVGLIAVLRGLLEAVESGEPLRTVWRVVAVIEAARG
ncbi:hypothetical protein [Actinokineospora terrae]|uniref:Uncharacterized protein n=1 Tax=Actinokineospora terrae TaxID=155974 RepID=A0A1H9NZ16_9PSEU|nr:hypothetical protein [Actinokineospora terrae]SER41111.1 hypothetical protein SAMN04487818_103207 [Actinokineospora terrae]